MVYSGAWGKVINEKNQKSKILWHCLIIKQLNNEHAQAVEKGGEPETGTPAASGIVHIQRGYSRFQRGLNGL